MSTDQRDEAGREQVIGPGETVVIDAPGPLTGQMIEGRYLLHELLGEGGMGSVYRATHVLMEKLVAIKLIHPILAHLPDVARRFEREARLASRLSDPHCITVTDFGRAEDSSLYLVMELLEGEELASRLKREGKLPLFQAVDVAAQILQGLAHAHVSGVVHRDLKPENVMLVRYGEQKNFAKVFDFGIAKLASDTGGSDKLTQRGFVIGTPAYLSPEQAIGGESDHRVDIYAVGVMLYEMITGAVPFRGGTAMEVMQMHLTRPVPALELGSRAGIMVQAVIERAMAKRPEDRYQTASEFFAALECIDFSAPEIKPTTIETVAVPSEAPFDIDDFPRPSGDFSRAMQRVLGPLNRRQRTFIIVLGIVALLGLAAAVMSFLALSPVGSAEETKSKSAQNVLPYYVATTAPGAAGNEEKLAMLYAQAELELRTGHFANAKDVATGALAVSEKQPIGHLLFGHAEFLLGNRTAALAAYDRALALHASVGTDARLIEHLAEALKSADVREKAATLLVKHCRDKGITLLAAKANSALATPEERGAARQALIDNGHKDAVDWLAGLTADFNQDKSCKRRKEVIALMVATGDPRFVPLLESAKPSLKRRGLFHRTKVNECTSDDVTNAIQTLSAGKAAPQGVKP